MEPIKRNSIKGEELKKIKILVGGNDHTKQHQRWGTGENKDINGWKRSDENSGKGKVTKRDEKIFLINGPNKKFHKKFV